MLITPLYPEGKLKALTFSYDDGARSDLRLIEIFNRFGMKGTFNLNAGRLQEDNVIHADELKTVYAGHEIAAHGYTHPFLERIPNSCALNEMLEDRRRLEKITGSIINGFALPFGTWLPETVVQLKAAGFLYSRTTRATERFNLPDNFLEWHPTCHHRQSEEMCEAFKKYRYPLALCYFWGHSFEFDRNNNWDLIEHVCSELSGREEIWYATNREIVRYLTALKRLETSEDAGILYNPSAETLWFTASGKVQKIEGGETLYLE